MKSMTGYGKGTAARDGREVTVEMRSVNNRFLEIAMRLPKNFLACDELLRSVISERIGRGSVDVFFNYTRADSGRSVSVNEALARQYKAAAEKLSADGIFDDLGFSTLLHCPDVITSELAADDEESMLALTKEAALQAVDALDKMRLVEGEGIARDLSGLIEQLSEQVREVKLRAPAVVEEYRAKLADRINKYLESVERDEARFLNEVAFFADKADINEELQRLGSHIGQFRDALASDAAMGRKLDFISQEIGREINTLGSKSNDIQITRRVVEMKNILEKIKEQIRNVE